MLQTATYNTNDDVQKYILRKISSTAPGQKLPSLREIREKYSVSQSTVDRIMDEFKASGLVEVLPRKGYFKSQKFEPLVRILYSPKEDPFTESEGFYNASLSNMILELSTQGRRVDFKKIKSLKELEYFDRTAPYRTKLHHLSETLITFSLCLQDLHYVKELEESGHKILHFLPNFTEPQKNSLIIRDENLIRKQIEYLISKGHKKIAYIHSMDKNNWSRPDNERYEAFCRMAIQYRLEVLPEYLKYVSSEKHISSSITQLTCELLECNPRPTAIILGGDRWVKNVYQGIRLSGFEPGKDISIIGTNNRPWTNYVTPGLTSVGFDINLSKESKNTVAKLADMVKGIESGNEYSPFEIPICLIERDSVHDINNQRH